MKKIIFSLLFVVGFSFISVAQDHKVDWQTDYDKAVKKAKKQDKPILLFFTGSDWCGPCKMLVSDFFESKKFAKIAKESLIIYEADFPRNKDLLTQKKRKKNYYLSTMYDVSSYPTIVIIDKNGNEIARKKSYNLMRDPSYHFQFLKKALNKI
ncbi:MAG: thioredoxin family protein [Flavobacteriaceae bacterium]|nr:thioredoxin family protein [Flavobacteriaceae bacterium]